MNTFKFHKNMNLNIDMNIFILFTKPRAVNEL